MPSKAVETGLSPSAGIEPAEDTGPHRWRGYFLVAAATFCWAAAAIAGKAIFSGRLFAGRGLISPVVLSQTRTTFALLLLAPLLRWRFGPVIFQIGGRSVALCLLVGTLGIAGSNFFYYFAIQKTTVATAITLQYTSPVWVLLYMTLRRRQRATPRQVGAVALAMAGIALTIGLFHSGIRLDALGLASALLSAFSFSFYLVAGQGLVARHHPFIVMNYSLLGAAMLWLLVNPPWRLLEPHYSAGQWGFLFLFSCLSLLLPYLFYFSGLKYLDPTRAVITGCLEPVFAILFAAVFVQEAIRGAQAAGIAAVLAATMMIQMER